MLMQLVLAESILSRCNSTRLRVVPRLLFKTLSVLEGKGISNDVTIAGQNGKSKDCEKNVLWGQPSSG